MIDAGFYDALGQAKKLLAESPFDELRNLRVERDGDDILLRGQVHSFYYKQLAQETVRTATCGIHLINAVDVD